MSADLNAQSSKPLCRFHISQMLFSITDVVEQYSIDWCANAGNKWRTNSVTEPCDKLWFVQSTHPIQEHPEEMRSFVWVTVTGCNFSEKAFVTGHPSPFLGVSALEAV